MKIKLYINFVFQIRVKLIYIRASHWITDFFFQFYYGVYNTNFASRYIHMYLLLKIFFRIFCYIYTRQLFP